MQADPVKIEKPMVMMLIICFISVIFVLGKEVFLFFVHRVLVRK